MADGPDSGVSPGMRTDLGLSDLTHTSASLVRSSMHSPYASSAGLKNVPIIISQIYLQQYGVYPRNSSQLPDICKEILVENRNLGIPG